MEKTRELQERILHLQYILSDAIQIIVYFKERSDDVDEIFNCNQVINSESNYVDEYIIKNNKE